MCFCEKKKGVYHHWVRLSKTYSVSGQNLCVSYIANWVTINIKMGGGISGIWSIRNAGLYEAIELIGFNFIPL